MSTPLPMGANHYNASRKKRLMQGKAGGPNPASPSPNSPTPTPQGNPASSPSNPSPYHRPNNLPRPNNPPRRPGPSQDDKPTTAALVLPSANEEITSIGDYQVIESIGRGAFGVVYRGISAAFETVAIKRVFLPNVPTSELEAIEMEIQLLKGLSHPNIVQYRDAVRTSSHLNIVLEFVENGSLSSFFSKMKGNVPEKFVAFYTVQVLSGLAYLHKQGVIHRDIKGANILTTKDGYVKLADFGVATKLNQSRKNDSVVGTPYWMAPEIIEMKGGQGPACDIWSVGCTVIELLTGKPPYYDLPQMTALFKIVQDDLPPLPPNITGNCEDFLRECFQKDPNRRTSAEGLLRHAWLREAHESLKKKQQGNAQLVSATVTTSSGADPSSAPSPHNVASTSSKPTKSADLKQWQEAPSDDEMDDWELDAPRKAATAATTLLKPSGFVPSGPPVASASLDLGDSDEWSDFDDDAPASSGAPAASASAASKTAPPPVQKLHSVGAAAGNTRVNKNIDSYAEFGDDGDDDDLDFGEDVFAKVATSVAKTAQAPAVETSGSFGHLATRQIDEDEDPFDGLDQNETQDESTMLMQQFDRLVQGLQYSDPSSDESTMSLTNRCEQIKDFLIQNPSVPIIPRVVMPLIELLPLVQEPALYSLVSLAIVLTNSPTIRKHTSFFLLIPALLQYASVCYSHRVRISVCTIIGLLCSADDNTRKVFIASSGINTLLALLLSDHNDQQSELLILLSAVDSLKQLFTHDIEVLRATCNSGGVERVAMTLFRLAAASVGMTDPSPDGVLSASSDGPAPEAAQSAPTTAIANNNASPSLAPNHRASTTDAPTASPTMHDDSTPHILQIEQLYSPINVNQVPKPVDSSFLSPISKLVSILELFSNRDNHVKAGLYEPQVFKIIIALLTLLQAEDATTILKILRVLSVNTNAHPQFEQTPAIQMLVAYLYSPLIEHQLNALQCLYHLCSTNVPRQIKAAHAGIIPILVQNIRSKSPLSHFSFPILVWLTNSAPGRLEVRRNNGFELFLDSLSNPFYAPGSLQAIASLAINAPVGGLGNLSTLGLDYLPDSLAPGSTRLFPLLCTSENILKINSVLLHLLSNAQFTECFGIILRMTKKNIIFFFVIAPLLLRRAIAKFSSPGLDNFTRTTIAEFFQFCVETVNSTCSSPASKTDSSQAPSSNLWSLHPESLDSLCGTEVAYPVSITPQIVTRFIDLLRNNLLPTLHQFEADIVASGSSTDFGMLRQRLAHTMNNLDKLLSNYQGSSPVVPLPTQNKEPQTNAPVSSPLTDDGEFSLDISDAD